jgi:hypothetical protein
MMEPVTAKVQASFNINPNRSQTFLVSLVVLAAILAGGSAYLNDTPLGWAFLGLSALTFGAASLGWWKSQADVDSETAHPTSLALPQGGSISADARTIRDPLAIQHVLQMVDAMMTRQPLPDADGLIDNHLKLVPNSNEKAQAITHQINSDTQAVTNDLLDALKLSESRDTVAPVLLGTAKDKP